MSKKALIILADGFEEIEAITPIDILRRAGITLTIAGLTDTRVISARNLIIEAERKLDDLEDTYDALILPGGGGGAKNLASSNKVNNLISTMHEQKKIIAAICASPAVVLAPTGILNGKQATCYPGCESSFDATTTYINEPVVCEDNIITSQGPGSASAFAFVLVEKLLGKEESDKLTKGMLFV